MGTGLGRKSVACIMLLCLRMREFPVDVNVGRICSRLGWIPLDVETAAEVTVLTSPWPPLSALCLMLDQVYRSVFIRKYLRNFHGEQDSHYDAKRCRIFLFL